MTIFAPYCYNWSLGNSLYKIDSLQSAKRTLNHDCFISCFVISNGFNDVHANVSTSINDLKAYTQSGGKLIISFGGASGPFLENTMSEDRQFEVMANLLTETNCRAIDFDVEGAEIMMIESMNQRNKVIKRLLQRFPDLWISFTLAVGAPSQWDKGGLPLAGINFVNKLITDGIPFKVINCMLMDTYSQLPAGKTWGMVYQEIMESVYNQLSNLLPGKSSSEIYGMLGLCPMIGLQDDNTTCSLQDVELLAKWAQRNNCGLFTYWSLQRDQVGKGMLSVYSQVNNLDYEFFNVIKNNISISPIQPPQPQPPQPQPPQPQPPQPQPNIIFKDNVIYKGELYLCTIDSNDNLYLQSTQPPVPPPTPQPPTPQPPTPPAPSSNTWKENTNYKVGDVVIYNNREYSCIQAHTSLSVWTPDVVPSLWFKI
jgi:chitinase